jgi:hypothetical protein
MMTNERLIEQGLERSGRVIIVLPSQNFPEGAGRNYGNLSRMPGVSIEIRKERLQSISREHCLYTNPRCKLLKEYPWPPDTNTLQTDKVTVLNEGSIADT